MGIHCQLLTSCNGRPFNYQSTVSVYAATKIIVQQLHEQLWGQQLEKILFSAREKLVFWKPAAQISVQEFMETRLHRKKKPFVQDACDLFKIVPVFCQKLLDRNMSRGLKWSSCLFFCSAWNILGWQRAFLKAWAPCAQSRITQGASMRTWQRPGKLWSFIGKKPQAAEEQ